MLLVGRFKKRVPKQRVTLGVTGGGSVFFLFSEVLTCKNMTIRQYPQGRSM